MTSNKSVFLKEGTISLIGTVFEKTFNYLFLVVVTYLIAPQAFGQFVFVVSTLTLIYGIFNLNITRAISYFVPRLLDDGEMSQASGFIRRIGFVAVAITIAIGAVIALFGSHFAALIGDPESAQLFVLLAPLVPIYAFRDLFREVFRSFEKVRYIVLSQSIIFPIAKVTVTVIALFVTSTLVALVLGITIAWLISLATSLVLLTRLPLTLRSAERPDISWNRILDYSLPLVGFGIMSSMLTQIDLILLGVLSTESNVAFFRIAFTVAALGKMMPQMFKSISKPLFAKVSTSDDSSLSDFYLTTARWAALVTVPAGVFLIAEYHAIVSVLFSAEYSAAALAVPILVLGNAFGTFFGYHTMLLEATDHTRLLLVRVIAMLLANVTLDILLIPEYGIVGAAIGTSVGLLAGTLVDLGAVYRFEVDRFPVTRYHIIYFVVGIAVGAVLLLTPPVISPLGGLLLDGILLTVLYPLGCVILKGLTTEDAKIAEQAVTRVADATGYRPTFITTIANYGARP